MAQVLCHETCLQDKVLETHAGSSPKVLSVSLPCIREAVLADLNPRFFPLAREFATGNKLRREGRAPYLNLLRWLSQTQEGALDTKEAIAANPALKGSVTQVIDKGHLNMLIAGSAPIADLFHFEPTTELLTTEDPKLLYFIRHIIWSKFAKQVGYFSIDFNSRYTSHSRLRVRTETLLKRFGKNLPVERSASSTTRMNNIGFLLTTSRNTWHLSTAANRASWSRC